MEHDYMSTFPFQQRKRDILVSETLLHSGLNNHELPHCPQLRKEQMQHYVAETHFLSQEALVKATTHHCMQYLLGYVCPEKQTLCS
jgi:hypothetical protein